MQRRLAAILAADIVGYTRLMGADETGTLQRVKKQLEEILVPLITMHHGRVVKLMGDGLLVEFKSIVDATNCAIAWQDQVIESEADFPEESKITFRIGVNIGDVIIEGEDIFGDGVNVASRLEAIAEPGGICLSGDAYRQVKGKIDTDFEDLGDFNVKNVTEPVRVYNLIHSNAKPRSRNKIKPSHIRLVYAALLIIAVGVTAWFAQPFFSPLNSDQPQTLGVPKLSIAVLPFESLGGEQRQSYFADALTEDLTSDLSRINGSFVISRRTAAAYRGQKGDPRQISRELNVRYLLEGNVRREGNNVRVNTQLIDGRSGQQIWSERFEKPAKNMYDFQSEVTGQIARTLNLELKDAASKQTSKRQPRSLDADDLALRAWAEIWNKPQSRQTNAAGLKYVSRALEIDPDNAEALGVAAYAYARAATYGWGMSREEALKQGFEAGEKSASLDRKNADSLYALAFLNYVAGQGHKSQELLRETIELNQNHAPAYFFYGLNLIRLGKPRDSISWIERAFALSPRDPLRAVWYGIIARAHVLIGEDLKAIEVARKGTAANSKHSNNYAALAAAFAHLERMDEAKSALEDFKRLRPGITIKKVELQLASTDPVAIKTYARLMSGLRKAGLAE